MAYPYSQKNEWYISSSGEGLSLTIKGALIGLIPLFIFVGQQFKIELTQENLTQGIQLISELISASIIVVGLLRKAWNWAKAIIRR